MKTFISTLLAPIHDTFSQIGFSLYALIFWILVLIYITLTIILWIRRIAVCFLESIAVYTPDKVLKKHRPYYLNRTKWDNIRKKAINYKVNQDNFCDFIKIIKPYYFTDIKIDYLQDKEWKSLVHKALGR